jgi:hypothetical protein
VGRADPPGPSALATSDDENVRHGFLSVGEDGRDALGLDLSAGDLHDAILTRASVQTWVRQVKKELPRYEPIQEDALAAEDEAEDVDDQDVRSAADLLVEMVRHRHDVVRSFVEAVEGVTHAATSAP